jgi:hypothetical protein
MPRFFFDLQVNGQRQSDHEGLECGSMDAVRAEVMRFLPEFADERVPTDRDHRAFVMHVRDEEGRPVYIATVTFTGIWLEAAN